MILAAALAFLGGLVIGSFVTVVASLIRMDVTALRPSIPTRRAPGQLREGLAYVRATPALAVPAPESALPASRVVAVALAWSGITAKVLT